MPDLGPPGGDPAREVAVARQLGRLLAEAPAYRAMDAGARQELDRSLAKIAGYLDDGTAQAMADRLAAQMAPDLRARIGAGGGTAASPASGSAAPPAPAAAPAGPGPAGTGPGGGGAVGRVGEVARATLNAINFPEFVASLIQGTFQAIVDASIQQMEAYAELLKNVASTVDRFMQDNISDGVAKDYLADQ